MWRYVKTEELIHFGIKGMKWGVRRYQNKDGTLTKAGRKRAELEEESERRRLDSDKRLFSRIKNDDDIEGRTSLRREIDDIKYPEDGTRNEEYRRALLNTNKTDTKHLTKMVKAQNKIIKKIGKAYREAGVGNLKKPHEEVRKAIDGNTSIKELKAKRAELDIKMAPIYKKLSEERKRNASGVLLKGLGYEDTDAARKWLIEKGLV